MSLIHDTQVREEDLQAYVDGLLDMNLRGTVEAYLALHPEEAERVTAYRAQNVALHQAYDFMIKMPVPTAIEGMAEKLSSGGHRGVVRNALHCASFAAVVAAAGATGWVAHNQWLRWDDDHQPFSSFTRRAIEAHAMLSEGQSLPLAERGVEGGNALVGWLANRTVTAQRAAPDLQDFGLSLAGGRIFFVREQLVVQLIYENAKKRLSLYVGAIPSENKQTSFTFVQQADLSTFYWRQGRLEFSLVGRMERERLLDVAKIVHDQLGMTSTSARETPQRDVRPAAVQSRPVASPPEPALNGTPAGDVRLPQSRHEKQPEIGAIKQNVRAGF